MPSKKKLLFHIKKKLDQITCGIGEENRLGTYMSRTLKHTD